jgi:hypothetical protein
MSGFGCYYSPGKMNRGEPVHPVIISQAQHIGFWRGVVKPSAEELTEFYKAIGRAPSDVFPVTFSADIWVRGRVLKGSIPGFYHLADWSTGQVDVLR